MTPKNQSEAASPIDDIEPRCLQCDYMLRGLTSDRCPECGTTIDWVAVREAATHKGLPIDRRTGTGKISGAVATWFLVLFRPRKFADDLSERSSTRLAMAFAIACMLVGITANLLVGLDKPGLDELGNCLAWAAGCWFHIECQSLLFFLIDIRPHRRLQQWAFWRKVSLYTTAFVVLDWVAGPPLLEDYWGGNFPWPLDRDTFKPGNWWPIGKSELEEIARGLAYYWWMAVLTLTLWRRLRRKWTLIIILLLMPAVTMASCRVGIHFSQVIDDIGILP